MKIPPPALPEALRSNGTSPHWLVPYAGAGVAVGIAFAIRFGLSPLLENRQPYASFYIAVMVASWLGGLGPALTATLIGFPLASFFFLSPDQAFPLGNPENRVGSISYFAVTLAITALGEAMHRARRQAERAAAEIDSQRIALEQEIAERRAVEKHLKAQHQLNSMLGEAHSLNDAAPHVLCILGDGIGWDVGAIWVVDAAKNQLRCMRTWHRSGVQADEFLADTEARTFAPGAGLPGRIWESAQPVWIEDFTHRAKFPRAELAARSGLRSTFGFPIRAEGEVIGVVEFFSKEPRKQDAALLEMGAAVGAKLGQFVRRERAEQALGERDSKLRSIVDHVVDGVITISGYGEILSFNPAAERIFGFSRAEVLGQNVRVLIAEQYHGQHDEYFKTHPETGQRGMIGSGRDVMGRRKDGTVFPLELAVSEFAIGEQLFYTAILRDVTDRRVLEAESHELTRQLQRRVAEFQTLIDTNPIGIAVAADPECRHIWSNPAFARLMGSDPAQNFSKTGPEGHRLPFKVCRNGAEIPDADLPMQRCCRLASEVRNEEEEIVRADGVTLHLVCSATPLFDERGNVRGCIAAFLDITERKRAERELMRHAFQQQHLYELIDTVNRAEALPAIFDAALDTITECLKCDRAAILLYDEDKVMRFKAWRGLSDDYRTAVEGHSPWESNSSDPQPVWISNVNDCPLESRQREIITREGIRALACIPLQYRGQLLGRFMIYFNSRKPEQEEEVRLAKTIAGHVAFAMERKKAEQALMDAQLHLTKYASDLEARVAQRTARLQENVNLLESFCYSIAHDLRAPLRAMQGFTHVLVDEHAPNLNEEGRNLAVRIMSASERMDRLLRDLLSFARMGHKELPLESVQVDEIIDAAVAEIAGDIRQADGGVTVIRPLPVVKANKVMLTEIVINLISNSLKFVEPGVRPHVKVRAETTGAIVRVWFEDNGIGIAPEHHDRIFRIFERLHESTAYAGTGIGLAIVRKGMERMGGNVGVESEFGKGSRFWIELPLA